jgi:hypothetical protein
MHSFNPLHSDFFVRGTEVSEQRTGTVEVQKRTAEYRITNNERRRKDQKGFNFIIRNSLFDIRHSFFPIPIWLGPRACIRRILFPLLFSAVFLGCSMAPFKETPKEALPAPEERFVRDSIERAKEFEAAAQLPEAVQDRPDGSAQRPHGKRGARAC